MNLDISDHRSSDRTECQQLSRRPVRGAALALTILASALLAPIGQAGDPAGANYPHQFSFSEARYPVDVAPYAPGDVPTYVFVSTFAERKIHRYAGTGSAKWLQLSVAPPLPPMWKTAGWLGLAANDRPGSSTFGRLLVTDSLLSPSATLPMGVLWQFDTALNSLWGSVLYGASTLTLLRRPSGVALDEAGNVYVIDEVTRLVYRYDHDAVALIPPGLVSTQTYGSGLKAPTGVSVDHNGRVHLTYLDGEYTVYEPGGNIASSTSISTSLLRGVCAVQPCADGFTTKYENGYKFDRVDWDWVPTMSGAADLTVALGVPPRPFNLEYQKFNFIAPGQGSQWGWTQYRCQELLYVAGPPTEVAAFGQHYDSVALPLGKRAWYRFEEVHEMWPTEIALPVADYLGTNVATPGPVAPRNVEGMVRSAFDSRAGTAYASAPDSPDLRFGAGSMTIEGWVRSEQRFGVATILDKRNGTDKGYVVYIHDGRIGLQVNDGSWQNFTGATLVADGRWRHFAVVVDRGADTLAVYVDGQFDSSTTLTVSGSTDSTASLYLGRHNLAASGTPLHGAIDEITLYDQALSGLQIADIAAARSAGKHLFHSPPF